MAGEDGSIRGSDLDGGGEIDGVAFDLQGSGDEHLAAGMGLAQVDIREAGAVKGFQADIFPDAGGW
jgi:hypothetical protein